MQAGPRVLLYHRVFMPDRDPQLLCVSPENFRAQMQWLNESCTVLPLAEIARRSRDGDVPNNAVSITFDDGYFDNLAFAKPILAELGMPATVFVSSGFVDSITEMWWDELERILLSESPPEWDVTQPPTMQTQRDYLTLCGELKFASIDERIAILREQRGANAATSPRASHRGLTAAELIELSNGGLVEIGGHTIDHPALSRMPADVQRAQIQADKSALENILARPVTTFAYPFGTPTEVDSATENLARNAGYEWACANVEGPVNSSMRPHHIPREIVRNWDVTAFAVRVSSWLYGR